MVVSGLSQQFIFNSQTYNADDCIQSSSLNRSVNAGMYQCGGSMKTALGAKTYVFNASLALAATDTTKVGALQEGDNGTDFAYWPAGVATGNIKMTSTKAWVASANYSAPVNGVITVDLTINLDALTDTTSS